MTMGMRMRMKSIGVTGAMLCDALKLPCWGVVDGERVVL
jgi:hypothetical protein